MKKDENGSVSSGEDITDKLNYSNARDNLEYFQKVYYETLRIETPGTLSSSLSSNEDI
jgi:hypothetical protein